MESNSDSKPNIDVKNMNIRQTFIVVHNLIHKAQQKGVFNLDEAVIAKYALSKLQTTLGLEFKKKEKK